MNRTARTRRAPRSRLSTFLYVHGPDVGACVLLSVCAAICAADYVWQPHGVTHFVTALVGALLGGAA